MTLFINKAVLASGPFKNWTGNKMVAKLDGFTQKKVLWLFSCTNSLGYWYHLKTKQIVQFSNG
jgi:hypothetical protein